MRMRNAGEREPQQEVVAAPCIHNDIFRSGSEGNVPCGQTLFDFGKLFGMQRCSKERRTGRMREHHGRCCDGEHGQRCSGGDEPDCLW